MGLLLSPQSSHREGCPVGDPLRLLRASRLHTRTPSPPIVGPAPRPAWVPTLWVPLVWGPPTHPPVPCWHSALWWQVEPQRRGSPKTSRPISVIGDSPGTRPGEVTLASWGMQPSHAAPSRHERKAEERTKEMAAGDAPGTAGYDGGRDPETGARAAPRSRNDEGVDFPLELWERNAVLLTPCCGPGDSHLTRLCSGTAR